MSRRRKNALLQRVEYLLYRAAARAVRAGSEAALRRWGTRIGALARHVLRGRDRLAMRNLRETFPEKSDAERRGILNECWRHFGREALETIRMQHIPIEEIPSHCHFVNPEVLQDAIALGRGVMILSAHYGGWEISGLAVMAYVRNVHTVARPLDNELLERDLAAIRARTGVEVVDKKRAARFLLKALQKKGVVILLPDQAVQPREGILVPFVGRPAWTTDAPAKMALRQESVIVFGFCIPGTTGHRLEFEEPIRIDQLSSDEKNAEALTTRINDIISRRIAARPELWLWMHDRWKGNAPGEIESETSDGR
ncbi:MAG TPA: lysophospholipid acyltransferase family protein [Thermoanaerobaculia bacterium]|jgi:KDO2-lipid IV(A) lauroyltransferase|nr:lysophospholipid acyltransferase family protein [Thermoanaerobaculia bacterium]